MTVLVSSAVYGLEELLDQVYGTLAGFGYEVWMSHRGTVPVTSSGTAFEQCLAAVEKCDLFLSIISTRYGSGQVKDGPSITHHELLRAIELGKPRWILAHDHVPFARSLLADYGLGSAEDRRRLQANARRKSQVFQDLQLIDMYEAAIRADVEPLEERTGNWVQKYRDEEDALLFASAQFSRYDEVRRFLEDNLRDPESIRQRVAELGKKNET
ncbi:MAG: DUF4062 domain-containing protein [Fimbriimonas sp.]